MDALREASSPSQHKNRLLSKARTVPVPSKEPRFAEFATLVSEDSDNFLEVDYKLQAALNTTIIEDLSVWAVGNPNLSVMFDKVSLGLQKLDSWVPTNKLAGKNTLDSVCSDGFCLRDMPLGMSFDVGAITRMDNLKSLYVTCVLCTIAVGNSVVVDTVEDAEEVLYDIQSGAFPHNGDSLYIKAEQHSVYSQVYRMFNPLQILPRYIVKFSASSLVKDRFAEIPPTLKTVDVNFQSRLTNPIIRSNILLHIKEVEDMLNQEVPDKAVDTIYEVTKKSMLQLHDFVQEKMSIIISEEMLVSQQLERMQRLGAFISEQHQRMSSEEFVDFAEGTNALLATPAAYARQEPRSLTSIVPDLGLRGGIGVWNEFEKYAPEGHNGIATSIANGGTRAELRSQSGENARGIFRVPAVPTDDITKRREISSPFRQMVFHELGTSTVNKVSEKPKSPSQTRGKAATTEQVRLKNNADSVATKASKDEGRKDEIEQPWLHVGISADQALFTTGDNMYAVSPQPLKAYQGRAAEKKSEGIAIVDLLWANNLKGEEIIVRDVPEEEELAIEEDTTQQEEEQVPESPPQPESRISPDPPKPIWSADKNTAVYRRCETVAKRFKHHSLNRVCSRAKRRFEKQMAQTMNAETPPLQPFERSKLIPAGQQQELFWSIPTVGEDRYCSVKFVGSLQGGKRNVLNIHQLLRDSDSKASLLVIKSGDYTFGGYSPVIIPDDGEYMGTREAFLFSLTHGMKFPYHGRVRPKGWSKKAAPRDSIRGEEDLIQFGVCDMVLSEDMMRCTSSLEHSFGFGMPRDVMETFLAGRAVFSVDEVEVWRVGRSFETALIEDFETSRLTQNMTEDGLTDEESFSSGSEFSDNTFSTSTNDRSVSKSATSASSEPKAKHRHHHREKHEHKEKLRRGTNSVSVARMALEKTESPSKLVRASVLLGELDGLVQDLEDNGGGTPPPSAMPLPPPALPPPGGMPGPPPALPPPGEMPGPSLLPPPPPLQFPGPPAVPIPSLPAGLPPPPPIVPDLNLLPPPPPTNIPPPPGLPPPGAYNAAPPVPPPLFKNT